MPRQGDHLDDRELLMAIDRELTRQDQHHADEHLRDCSKCRERRQHLVQIAAIVARHLDSNIEEAESIRQSRARLSGRLAEAASHDRQPAIARMFAMGQRLAVTAALLAAAAALLLVVGIVGPGSSSRGLGGSTSMHDAALPIAALTPGATWTETADELCAAAERERRDIPAAVRDAVLRNYNMTSVSKDDYELDYLITPELGGAPDARNLWPQRYGSGTWNAHVKDQLEDLLPGLVCEGKVPLQTAQHDIADNWIAAYKRYFHTSVPLPKRLALSAAHASTAEAYRSPIWRATPAAPALRLVAMSDR